MSQRLCVHGFELCATCRPVVSPQDWPEDFDHENGQYFCHCTDCGKSFRGHKRRITCKLCVLSRNESGEAQPEGSQGQSQRDTSPETLRLLNDLVQRVGEITEGKPPFYAYGDNQAACDMSDRLDVINDVVREACELLRSATHDAPQSVNRPPASADALSDNDQGATPAANPAETLALRENRSEGKK